MLHHRLKSKFRIFLASLCIGLMGLIPFSGETQTVIGGLTPDPSAMLDVQGQSKGVLFPRMTTAERDAILPAATGLIIFNTSTVCLEINVGSSNSPSWQGIKCLGSITGINCGGATLIGSLLSNQIASGVSVSVPYTGGNGGVHAGQTVTSTVVTGLTATLTGGSFASGSGNLSYAITGTPSSAGTASFALNIGGQNCDLNLTVQQITLGVITGLSCNDAIRRGEMQPGIIYNSPSGVTVIVPYTGGNGDVHSGQTVTSTGLATGSFTATLSAGTFATGSGNLTYEITGSGATGTATFALNIGGSSCSLDLEVKSCSANIDASTTKTFLCYNLGAYNTRASSSAPSWEVNGGYWEWGIKAQIAGPGPIGPSAGDANSGAAATWTSNPWTPVEGPWNPTTAANGAWLDASKTVADPCPVGFRVPSKNQWLAVNNNTLNPITNVGATPWASDPTNYSTGKNFGSALFLPTAGYRAYNTGALINRGREGYYWSSTENGSADAWTQYITSGSPTVFSSNRINGHSVRCVAE